MGTKKFTRIVVETERTLLVDTAYQPQREHCPLCAAETEMTAPEHAAILARVPPRAIYRWIEAGQVHFVETQDGGVLVCTVSLLGAGGSCNVEVRKLPGQ
ncbi:MAG: hypothetical protein ACKV2V_28095 [Blastocatellia bacterium]